MHQPQATRDEGFSLIEALIAGGVLAAGILALGQVLVIAAAATVRARQQTFATVAAAQKVEELRAAPFAPSDGADQVREFRRRWRASWDDTDPADTLAVVVQVEPGGVRLATRRTRREP
jgi:Tfp pilus assembly protein PilV